MVTLVEIGVIRF